MPFYAVVDGISDGSRIDAMHSISDVYIAMCIHSIVHFVRRTSGGRSSLKGLRAVRQG